MNKFSLNLFCFRIFCFPKTFSSAMFSQVILFSNEASLPMMTQGRRHMLKFRFNRLNECKSNCNIKFTCLTITYTKTQMKTNNSAAFPVRMRHDFSHEKSNNTILPTLRTKCLLLCSRCNSSRDKSSRSDHTRRQDKCNWAQWKVSQGWLQISEN